MGPDSGRKDKAGNRYLIVADTGKKQTQMIPFVGTLKDAHSQARQHAGSGNYIIKREVKNGLGVFWQDVLTVGDY